MQTLEIKKNISNAEFKYLLEYIRNFAFAFTFVVRSEIEISKPALLLIKRLESYLIENKKVSEWPGTQLQGKTAELYKYRLDGVSQAILLETSCSLFDWVQPEMPEDLSFIYQNGQNCLTNISHEKDAWLSINDNEYLNAVKKLDGIVVKNN